MNQPIRFFALDGWRGILAIAVVCAHIKETGHLSTYAAVDVFFILSGFVLTHRYDDLPHRGAAWRFGLSRARRLFPMHLFVLALIVLFVLITQPLGLQSFWTTDAELQFTACGAALLAWDALLLNNILPPPCTYHGWGINGPSWSISIEMWVCFVLLPLFVTRSAARAPLALAIALAAYVYIALTVGHLQGVKEPALVVLNQGIVRGVAGFLLGFSLYHAWRRSRSYKASAWASTAVEASSAVWLLTLLIRPGQSGLDYQVPIAAAVLIVAHARSAGLLSKMLEARPFQALGAASFAIYLLHEPAIRVIDALAVPHQSVALFAAVFAVAAAYWRSFPLPQPREASLSRA